MIVKLSSLASALLLASPVVLSQDASDIPGNILADFRLRYETNDTDNLTKPASALTLRSRVGYDTGAYNGLSALVEIEDVRALIDDYAAQNRRYDPVADPVNTEINRAQIAYTNAEFSAVAGRQRIVLDNARFVGNVGWRQNEQTYDAIALGYKGATYNVRYAFIEQVNDIQFSSADVSHHLLNINYSGFKPGSLSGYAYLLKDDKTDAGNDTYGIRFSGKQALTEVSVLYTAEYAGQKTDDYSARYLALEGGAVVQGITLAAGYESLGSDNGAYGFQTPLATKHAFNGWADKFLLLTPNDGLTDTYVKVATQVAGVNLLALYHDYAAADGNDDKGSEVDLQAGKKISKEYSAGVKYAAYRKGDSGADTDKAWLWLEAKF